jgi:hypothetical protein
LAGRAEFARIASQIFDLKLRSQIFDLKSSIYRHQSGTRPKPCRTDGKVALSPKPLLCALQHYPEPRIRTVSGSAPLPARPGVGVSRGNRLQKALFAARFSRD